MRMHLPRKRFGQHFLHDKQIIRHIINTIAPKKNEKFVEIGPGIGALTGPMLKKIGTLDVIEIDRDVIPVLESHCGELGDLIIHQADALDFNLTTLIHENNRLRIFGNLPYNISTPLIFHLLEYAPYITDMHFMLQKEVVERLAALPHSKNYGRLSVMVQYHCKVVALFDVPPNAFNPPPKVFSQIVCLIPYQHHENPVKNYDVFANIVRQAFSQRRKTLRNSLKNTVSDSVWKTLGINSMLRAEELSVNDYINISNTLTG